MVLRSGGEERVLRSRCKVKGISNFHPRSESADLSESKRTLSCLGSKQPERPFLSHSICNHAICGDSCLTSPWRRRNQDGLSRCSCRGIGFRLAAEYFQVVVYFE